jgi:lipopolysaccharide biosynthesis glycosyltransferase
MEEADSRPFPGSPAHCEETAGSGTGSPDVTVVIFVADDHYAMPVAAAVTSVAANLDRERKAQVFIVDGGISLTNKSKVMRSENRERVRIQWLQPSESQSDLLKSLPCGYVGRTAYLKMLVPELLGPEYPRIIYLDCDVIVETDINALWEADLGENYVLAVQDLINPFVSSPFGLRNWRELGRKADDELFNTGVLVLNAAKWRKENVTLNLVQYLKDHYQYVQLCDQDAMNAVFRGGWGRLDSRWNVLPYMNIARSYSLLSKKSHEQLLKRAYLLHFCGPDKPWSARCRHPQRDRFFRYLDMTAWSGWRPKWWAVDRDLFVYYMRRVLSMLRR